MGALRRVAVVRFRAAPAYAGCVDRLCRLHGSLASLTLDHASRGAQAMMRCAAAEQPGLPLLRPAHAACAEILLARLALCRFSLLPVWFFARS
jgi:hypothetical protein